MINLVAKLIRALAVLLPALAVGLAAMALYLFIPAPRLDDSLELEPLTQAYEALDVSAPDHETLVVGLTRDIHAPVATVWALWSRVEDWPSWDMEQAQAEWIGTPSWDPGSQIRCTRTLGFPLGTITMVNTIQRVSPNRLALWTSQQRGLRVAHAWRFDDLGDGRTRVTTVEVMQGWKVALVKPMVTRAWQANAERSLSSLANVLAAQAK